MCSRSDAAVNLPSEESRDENTKQRAERQAAFAKAGVAEFYSKSARLEDAIKAKQQQLTEQRAHTDRKFAEQRINTKVDMTEVVTEYLDKRFGPAIEEEGMTARGIYLAHKKQYTELIPHLSRSRTLMLEEERREKMFAEGMSAEEVKQKLAEAENMAKDEKRKKEEVRQDKAKREK